MTEILYYVSNGLIILSFVGYFLLVSIGIRKKVTKSDGFNITKDILDEYDSINIILDKGYFTIYNIGRKVIKIANWCYFGNGISNIAIPLIEAGISNCENKSINIFKKIIPNLKLMYALPLIALIINNQTNNISDAKVSIVVFILFLFISYIIIDIKNFSFYWVKDKIVRIKEINNINREKIINFIKTVIILDKLIFMSELLMIIRSVMILLEM